MTRPLEIVVGLRSLVLVGLAIVAAASAIAAQTPHSGVKWRIVPTKYPTADIVVAGCTVGEFGARGDGSADDTGAFQAAVQAMADAGGGTVFVPEGRYAIRGNLTVPTGVTLRGDREKPVAGRPVRGTILMAYAGRGKPLAVPFITLKRTSGVKALSIWYPEQDAAHITPYPASIRYSEFATIEDVTLVNSYTGILDPVGSTYVIRNVCGSPLFLGMQIDVCVDTGRMENIDFRPDFWSDVGLPGAPPRGGPHAQWMLANGTAIRFLRIDWQCGAFVHVDGYKIGLELLASRAGPSWGEFHSSTFTHCRTAVSAAAARFPGFLFTRCVLEGSDAAVSTSGPFDSFMGFHSCTLRGGQKAVDVHGKPALAMMFHQCDFEGEVAQQAGCLSLLGCRFHGAAGRVTIGQGVRAATVAGSKFDGPPRIAVHNPSDRIRISDDTVPQSKLPTIVPMDDRVTKPSKAALYVVTDNAWGAKKDSVSDDTAAIQRALDSAAGTGGGVVFLPAGEFVVRGHLRVPSGVELRGIYDISHDSIGKGSTLRIYAGRGNEAAAPAIAMDRTSGMRGVTLLYPEQRYDRIAPYPYSIQGRGADIYVANITAINSYKILDFLTWRCDRHFLDRVFGGPLRVGIAVGGGSVDGEVRDANLNPGIWTTSPYLECPGTPDPKNALNPYPEKNPVMKYVVENLEAFVYGDCTSELEVEGAVCPARHGIHFMTQDGRGASGLWLAHDSDWSQASTLFDGLGPCGVDFINTNLIADGFGEKRYCGSDFRFEARFYNLATWGLPDYSAAVKSGSLVFELAHFCNYGSFLVEGGKLALTNVYLSGGVPAEKELVIRGGGRIAVTGTITPHGMHSGADAPAGALTSKFDTFLSEPAKATGAGPIAAWTFDEGQGRWARDVTGHGHRAILENVQWKKDPQGYALAFSGADNSRFWIDTRTLPPLESLTIETWVRPEKTETGGNLVFWPHRLLLRINDKKEASRFAGFVTLADGSMEPRVTGPIVEFDAWQHVALVWDGAYLQLWVNGRRVAESERPGALMEAYSDPLFVGFCFRGMIRGLRLYDRPLADEEIRAHCRAESR